MAIRAGLPLADRPPVNAMPRPILMGSAARAVSGPRLASATAPTATPTTAHLGIRNFLQRLIGSSLSRSSAAGASDGRQTYTGTPGFRQGNAGVMYPERV